MRIFLILLGITLLSISAFALPLVIDPGHGGFDSGIKGTQIDEKDFTLMLSNEIVSLLNEANQQAVLIRQTSRYLSFNERAMVVEKTGAKAFLSIHGSKTGYSVYICRFPKDEPTPKEKYDPEGGGTHRPGRVPHKPRPKNHAPPKEKILNPALRKPAAHGDGKEAAGRGPVSVNRAARISQEGTDRLLCLKRIEKDEGQMRPFFDFPPGIARQKVP
jgi:hypothetical protein